MATSQSQTVVQLLISLQVETNRQKTSWQQQRVQRQLQVWIKRDNTEIDTAVEVVMTKAIERGRCFPKFYIDSYSCPSIKGLMNLSKREFHFAAIMFTISCKLCFCMCIVQCELFIIGLYSRLESRSSFYDKLDGHIVYSQ